MEELRDYEEPSIPVLGALNIARHIRNRRRGWKLDLLSFRPLHDRPSPISTTASATGPIGTLARIEMNARAGRPLEDGLPPDALNQPNAP